MSQPSYNPPESPPTIRAFTTTRCNADGPLGIQRLSGDRLSIVVGGGANPGSFHAVMPCADARTLALGILAATDESDVEMDAAVSCA